MVFTLSSFRSGVRKEIFSLLLILLNSEYSSSSSFISAVNDVAGGSGRDGENMSSSGCSHLKRPGIAGLKVI